MKGNNITRKASEESIKIQKSILDRLNRVEGQIRGIKGMIEKGTYCDDIIIQIEASRSALSSIALILLEGHMKNCVINNIKEGNEESIEDTLKIIKKLIK